MKTFITFSLTLLLGVLYQNANGQGCNNKPCTGNKICVCGTYYPVAKQCHCIRTFQLQDEIMNALPDSPQEEIEILNSDNNSNVILPISNSGIVSFNIFDLNGSLIYEQERKSFTVIDDQIQWNTKDLHSGIYILQIVAKDHLSTQKLVVTRN